MKSIEHKDGQYVVDGRRFKNIRDVLSHFDIQENVAITMMEAGISLNELIARNKNKTTFASAFAVLENGLNNPELFGRKQSTGITERPYNAQFEVKFSKLREKNQSIQLGINELHKFADKTAKDFENNQTAHLAVFNTVFRLFDDIGAAVQSRWIKFNPNCSSHVCDVNDIKHGCYYDRTPEHYESLIKARNADILVIRIPNHDIGSQMESSLGTLLRQRLNQSKTTVILMTTGFYFSLSEYTTYLKESFSEYGKNLTIIEANPSFQL